MACLKLSVLLLLIVISKAQNYIPYCKSAIQVFNSRTCSVSGPDVVTGTPFSSASTPLECGIRCEQAFDDAFAARFKTNPTSCLCYRSASNQGVVSQGSSDSSSTCIDCRQDLAEEDGLSNGVFNILNVEGPGYSWDIMEVSTDGVLIAAGLRGFAGSYNAKTLVVLYDMGNPNGDIPLHTIYDPTDTFNAAGPFGEVVRFFGTEFLAITARHEKKIYIYNTTSFQLLHTVDGTFYGTNFPETPFSSSYLGQVVAGVSRLLVDVENYGHGSLLSCGTTSCVITKFNGVTWTSRTVSYNPTERISISISYGGRWVMLCHQGASGSTMECFTYNPDASGNWGARLGIATGASSLRGDVQIVMAPSALSNSPIYVIFRYSVYNSASLIVKWITSGSYAITNRYEQCVVDDSGGTAGLWRFDNTNNYLYRESPLNGVGGRCIVKFPTILDGVPDVIAYIDKSNFNVAPTAQTFGARGDVRGNTAVYVAQRITTDVELYDIGIFYSYDYIIPPPTASPTLSPTERPTFECVDTEQCVPPSYCSDVNTCVVNSCSDNYDCVGEFLVGRLPYCDKRTSQCRDRFAGTCQSPVECDEKVFRAVSAEDKLGSIKVVNSNNNLNITLARHVMKTIYDRYKTNSSLVDQDVYVFVDGTETANFPLSLIGNDNTNLFDNIRSIVCPGELYEYCDVAFVSSTRLLQGSGSIAIQVTYSISSDLFDQLIANGTSFSDGSLFEQALADALGISVEDITISSDVGEFVVEYIVAQEAIGDDPLLEENLNSLQSVSTELAIILSTTTSEFGLNENDIQLLSVDYCSGRDCNGRGTCNPSTGVCTCTNTDYWGVNCETFVTCLNNGVKEDGVAYCICEYPYYGLRCGSTQDCECQTT